MTRQERADWTLQADLLCRAAFDTAACPDTGVALVAVGGYGREELAPHSDLDVVLVHVDGLDVGSWAADVWYPLWDSGHRIDHAVRSRGEVLDQVAGDLKVALGMLDVRHLAGDPNLTLRLRTEMLAAWRRDARRRLPELRELVLDRGRRLGELADAAVPDLKESVGGLRDATVLKALVATWLVDVPHADLERTRSALLDTRDALHALTGRPTDRVTPEYWADLAHALELPDALAAQRHVRGLGRRVTHLGRLTWRRVEAVLRAPGPVGRGRRPALESLGHGVAVSHREVVLDAGSRPDRDPLLLLRAAAEAAERDLVLAPTTAARLAREAPELPDPWPLEARELLVRLLGAGPSMLGVWETLEETGATDRLLPEWAAVRLLPHAATVHRFTVDRHLVQTCVEASRLLDRVSRPDVLLVAALLHDIGKGEDADHSIAGERLARGIAARLGFDQGAVDLVGLLVRRHLLLPETATTRDLDDPGTLASVQGCVQDVEQLELLAALTEADARATSEKAWSRWRAGLVGELVDRLGAVVGHRKLPTPAREWAPPDVDLAESVRQDPTRVHVAVRQDELGSTVTIASGDRVALLADCAALLASQGAEVRAARAWQQHVDGVDVGVTEWRVERRGLDAAALRTRLEAIVTGRVDPAERLRPRSTSAAGQPGAGPAIVVHPDASERATVLEVRAADEPGLVHQVCRALAGLDLAICSAHVDTLGGRAVDVFYVHEPGAGALTDARAAAAVHAVREALARQ
jgi:[protein-PII] uridylyltransferase